MRLVNCVLPEYMCFTRKKCVLPAKNVFYQVKMCFTRKKCVLPGKNVFYQGIMCFTRKKCVLPGNFQSLCSSCRLSIRVGSVWCQWQRKMFWKLVKSLKHKVKTLFS